MTTATLLVELLTEELPPKALSRLGEVFSAQIHAGLAARKLLKPEVANDKSLYPDADTISKGEWQNDVGDASRLYEEYYQKLKAGR